MDIIAVNDLSYEEFVNIFGNVVEKCPIVAAAVWSERPFLSFTALEAAINEFIDILPQSGRNSLTFSMNDQCVSDVKITHLMSQNPFIFGAQVKRGSSGVTRT